jgi:hypothetical protein
MLRSAHPASSSFSSSSSSSSFSRLASALTLGTLASLAPRASHAQSRPNEVAAAQALFDEARTLVHAGKFAEACPKFEESERLDAGPGTEFNLADCYEHAGRSASAWAQFTAVADSLHALGQRDREKIARDRAKALEGKLARLAVHVSAPARVAGLEVKRDGVVVGDAQWGSGVPVDPGKHVIVASAPGRQPWQQTIDVSADGKSASVELPTLALALAPVPENVSAGAPPVPSADPEPAPHSGDGQKIAAIVTGGIGIVALGVGAYFGSQAISKHNQYAPICPNNVCTDPSGVQIRNDASSDATYSTVALSVGAVAVVGAVVLYLTAPSSKPAAQKQGVHVVPRVDASARSGGLALEGTW